MILTLGGLVQTEAAYDVFLFRRNSLSLDLISNISEKKNFLGINWYNEYQKVDSGANSTEPRYDPLFRISAVTDKELYLKKYDKIWFDLDPKDSNNRKIYPHFSTVENNTITAYQMENNQTIITLALKNLTILTFDLNQKVNDSNPQLKPIMVFDSRYKVAEGDELIRSLGQVPYTNQIIFSPSRFEIFKIDRLTGQTSHRGRSPLDSINFIVLPVSTHRSESDPYNPNKKIDPKLNERVRNFTELTYFVMTSTDSGVNALVDWTNMKTIKYFSIRDNLAKLEDVGNRFKVRSICFFGGLPNGHLYPFIGSDVIRELFLFSAVNRHNLGKLELPQTSFDGYLSWVNHTNYIYILQTRLQGLPEYNSGSYFLNLGPTTRLDPVFYQSQDIEKSKRYLNPSLLAFDTNITSDEVYKDTFDRLDYFYLLLSSSGNSINFDVPPFNWDHCLDSEYEYKTQHMYYGRFHNCGENGCIGGFLKRSVDWSNKTFMECTKYKCGGDRILHLSRDNYSGEIVEQIKNDSIDTGKQTVKERGSYYYLCLNKYVLSENEKKFANDNGCSPGFNLDPNGICRVCKFNSYMGEKFYPSDCLLWIRFLGIWDDSLTYSYYHYNISLLDQKLYYKGFSGNEYYYRSLFKMNLNGTMNKDSLDSVEYGSDGVIRQSKSYSIVKRCYDLSVNQGKTPRYDLEAVQGFSLDLIENDPTGQAKSQIGVYGDGSPFNTFYCTKVCPQGYYYDFNSINCRRCNHGCALCKRFEKCDLCEPGFNLVKRPNSTTHTVDEKMMGQCQVGCQEGFYVNGFDGECLECHERCSKCMDALFVLKEKYNKIRKRTSQATASTAIKTQKTRKKT